MSEEKTKCPVCHQPMYLREFETSEYFWNTLRCNNCELIIMDDNISRGEEDFCNMFMEKD